MPTLSHLHEKKLKKQEKLTPIRIMKNIGLNNETIVNSVCIFDDIDFINKHIME